MYKWSRRLTDFPLGRAVSNIAVALGFGLLLVVFITPYSAAAVTGAISQSYQTRSSNLSQGALVSLTSQGASTVVPSSTNSATRLIGVDVSKPLVELSSGNGGQSTIQVAVGGSTEVLVSDMNGPVKAGDRVTVSPVEGIGMKATTAGEIVGVAQADLDSITTVTRHYASVKGGTVSAKVGLLPVSVNVAYYAGPFAGGTISAFIPPFIQNLADTLAGKPVPPLRVLFAFVGLLLGFALVGLILYIGIKSEVISIGRNPLASGALRSGLLDILITAVGVLVITGVIVAAIIIV